MRFTCVSLGLSVDVAPPNIEVHLPFGFVRMGRKSGLVLPGAIEWAVLTTGGSAWLVAPAPPEIVGGPWQRSRMTTLGSLPIASTTRFRLDPTSQATGAGVGFAYGRPPSDGDTLPTASLQPSADAGARESPTQALGGGRGVGPPC